MVIEVRVYLVRTDVNCQGSEVSMLRYMAHLFGLKGSVRPAHRLI